MRRYLVLTIIVLAFVSIVGCEGEKVNTFSADGSVQWVDMGVEGYPDESDSEFGAAFIKANKENLDELAEMMLSYNFEYYIDYNEDEIRVIIRTKTTSSEENKQRWDILQNEQMMAYISSLLDLQYIRDIRRSNKDMVFVDFTDMNSVWRSAKYTTEIEGNSRSHMIGNWEYISDGHI